jgi:hypothetical protein
MNFEEQKRKMDRNLFNAAFHLREAGKHLVDVDNAFGLQVLNMSLRVLNIIEAPKAKVEPEKMSSILDEIFSGE